MFKTVIATARRNDADFVAYRSGPAASLCVIEVATEEVVANIKLDPSLVSPAVVYLSHESCTLNGELIVAGAGQILRLALVESKGIFDTKVTPEMVAEQLETILDITGQPAINAGGGIFG